MKALMFGWEFPPHILGGLGTASYGLTRGMAQQEDMHITFVIPKPWGDEDQSFLRIIGANSVPVVWKDNDYEYIRRRMEGKMSPEEYYHLRDGIRYDYRRIGTDDLGCVQFSGRYPDNLIEEIGNYEAVASVLAHSLDFDIIHSHDWLTYPAGVFAKHISGKPLVIHVHATDFDRSRGNVNPTVYAIEKRGMDEADHIMCVSNLTRRTVIEKYGQDPAKVSTVHNAVEPLPHPEEFVKHPRKDEVVTFLGVLSRSRRTRSGQDRRRTVRHGRQRRQDGRDDRPGRPPRHRRQVPLPRLHAGQAGAGDALRERRVYHALRQ